MTKRLYYESAYIRNFKANVLSCAAGDGHWLVELDETAFYPEGGGQPGDRGVLEPEALQGSAAGSVNVIDTQEKDGHILHFCDGEIPAGTAVSGKIDWERRFDHMQQHSGEHIVSGMLCERYACDNVGFHMGADEITIDYNADIDWDGLMEVEKRANRYIWENHECEIHVYSHHDAAKVDYRSKKEIQGDIRICSFPGADTCACCGTHVKNSGEVGLVKFISCSRISKGTRIELLCGGRAMRCLSESFDQNREIAVLMAASPDRTAAIYRKHMEETGRFKLRISELEQGLFEKIAESRENAGDTVYFMDGLKPDSVRKLCVLIADKCGGRAAVFSWDAEACDFKYAVSGAVLGETGQHEPGTVGTADGGASGGNADGEAKFKDFIKRMNAALNGRGGGRGCFAQGSVKAGRREIKAFMDSN